MPKIHNRVGNNKLIVHTMKIIRSLLFFALALLSLGSFAQNGFSAHTGLAVPTGSFSETIGENDGGAATGFNIGAKYQYGLAAKEWSLFATADFMRNSLKSDYKDAMKMAMQELGGVDSFSSYINIPVIAGVCYTYTANSNLALAGNLGVGVDYLKVTDFKMNVQGETINASFDPTTQAAFRLGVDAIVNNRYTIGIHYFSLGSHSPKGEVESFGQSQTMDQGSKLDVSLFTVNVGVRLF